ncbi:MAG: hypothetical protein NC925_02775, partial [Candidatus Omnitrophica bacterium]|nr:hypothetical protein [Candidatus Omnitrophota bacterium]
ENEKEENELISKLPYYDLAIDLRRPPESRFLLSKIPSLFKMGYKSFSDNDICMDVCLETQIDKKGVLIEENKTSISLQLIRLIDSIPFSVVNLPKLASPLSIGKQIGIFPGAGVDARQWPIEYFVALCREIINSGLADILNIYLAQHEKYMEKFFSASPQVNICSGLNFDQLIGSLIQNQLVISNNSFGGHISSYLGIPVIAIYSGVETVWEWGPPFGNSIVLYSNLPCIPCHGLAKHCSQDLICLKEIKPSDVIKVIDQIYLKGVPKVENDRFFIYSHEIDKYPKILKLFESLS